MRTSVSRPPGHRRTCASTGPQGAKATGSTFDAWLGSDRVAIAPCCVSLNRRDARSRFYTPLLACACAAALFLSGGCSSPLQVNGPPSRTLSLVAGQKVDVRLQTVGPGEYSSPPTVSSSAVRFLGVSLVGPYVPAGPTQVFRFIALAPGQAIVAFHHTGLDPEVDDTINVR